jgi:hypothetical protein
MYPKPIDGSLSVCVNSTASRDGLTFQVPPLAIS